MLDRPLALSLVAALAVSAASLAPTAGAGDRGRERLPDLEQELPRGVSIVRAEPSPGAFEYRLAFRSAVRNVGDGPLVIRGARPTTGVSTMTADQMIRRGPRAPRRIRRVGRLRYVVSPDHRHWHLLGFERYELRRPGSTVARVEDRKTGFCLGDRYRVDGLRLPARSDRPVFTSRCGLEATSLLQIREGISVGYGDDYVAALEGQYLPLTGVSAGRYVLVHLVNRNRAMHELSYGNNAASILVRLRWRLGIPYLVVLARCPHSARCDR
jgi:Lysyl oxidase